MQNLKNLLMMGLLISLLNSCAPKKHTESEAPAKKANYIEASKEINEISEANAPKDIDIKNVPLADIIAPPKQEKNEVEQLQDENKPNYGVLFCNMMKENKIDNPFELEKFFSPITKRAYNERLFNFLKSTECNGERMVFDQSLLQLFQLYVPGEENLYLALKLDDDHKILSISIYWGKDIRIDYHEVPMSDGTKLTTFFYGTDKKLPTVMWRTPYMNMYPDTFFQHINSFNIEKVNMVFQANRGSFYSEGDFRWLHEENIADGRDAIDWITKQEFNNGKVIPYGVSYPGFNAVAAAISQHPAIHATVACSSPLNAKTDSLTASMSPTPRYISYVDEREANAEATNYIQKINYITNQENYNLKSLDQDVFGQTIQDWQDFVASYQEKDNTYWQKRNLLPKLHLIDKPIFHIAGLNGDQDSRDVILTYQYLQDNNINLNKHRLYLHQDGHGCGNFLKHIDILGLTADQFNSISQVMRYNTSAGRIISTPDYQPALLNIETIEIDKSEMSYDKQEPMISEDYFRIVDSENITSHKRVHIKHIIKRSSIFNGTISLEFEVESRLYKRNLSAFFQVTDERGQIIKTANIGTYGQFIKESDFGENKKIKIILEPAIGYLPRNGTLHFFIGVDQNAIDFNKKERESFYAEREEEGAGYVDILLTKPIKAQLPIERYLEPESPTLEGEAVDFSPEENQETVQEEEVTQ